MLSLTVHLPTHNARGVALSQDRADFDHCDDCGSLVEGSSGTWYHVSDVPCLLSGRGVTVNGSRHSDV